ncbi:hypothetical protein [Loktanella sp. 5RATIMAR09]|uniref:OsmC family protein n=1 Tax=Loktanella sp. 5RATIMAR09 TaxID=1225655 RepID=UPI000A6D7677|nr:hypothetical protein [Loktanella sp. 5RATIMAR09]
MNRMYDIAVDTGPDWGGNPDHTNPEQALASALPSCHMMACLALAAKDRYFAQGGDPEYNRAHVPFDRTDCETFQAEGDPVGVVLHHRGGDLRAQGNAVTSNS